MLPRYFIGRAGLSDSVVVPPNNPSENMANGIAAAHRYYLLNNAENPKYVGL